MSPTRGPLLRATLAAGIILGWASIFFAWHGQIVPAVAAGLAVTALFAGVSLASMRSSREERERVRQALERAARRNLELERLRQLAQHLLTSEDLPGLQRQVAQAAAELLQAEAAAVARLVEEGRFLRIEASAGTTGPVIAEGTLLPVERSVMGRVILEERAFLTDDLTTDPRNFDVGESSKGLVRCAFVPLRAAGLVIGALVAFNRREQRTFSASDIQLLETLAEQVAVGLDRAAVLQAMRAKEEVLAQKNAELERATRLKSEFLANMSHELRTPLNSIIGFSDLLLSGAMGDVSEAQQDFLESILRNGRHLLGLINSILDLSKIEAGRMTLALAPVPVREVVEAVVADTASLRATKRQHCEQALEDDGLVITADAVRVKQVLLNLLSNASKFTPEEGTIRLRVLRARMPLPVPADRAGDPDTATFLPRDVVWIAVEDNGIGIRPEDVGKLFREFSQVDSAFSRQQQGTGLGLALCKEFVELHGGTIGVESIPDVGSTFWFILPVEGPIRRNTGSAAATAMSRVGV